MRSLSQNMLAAIHMAETDAVFLPLVRLDHADWDAPVRIVADSRAITHAGETYQPFPFEMGLPDDEADGVPVLKWAADNVSGELIGLFRGVTGHITARVVWVLSESPDVIEVGPFEVELRSVEYDALQISGTMTVEPILDEPFGHVRMTPKSAPGLF